MKLDTIRAPCHDVRQPLAVILCEIGLIGITRALVSNCGGAFDLKPGPAGGVVGRVVLPAPASRSTTS